LVFSLTFKLKVVWFFFKLDKEQPVLPPHLPAGFAETPVFMYAFAANCLLVESKSTSSATETADSLINC
jgi:hypothetical protein